MEGRRPPRDINARRQFFQQIEGEWVPQPPPSLPAKLPFRELSVSPADPERVLFQELFGSKQPAGTDDSGYTYGRDWSDEVFNLLDQPRLPPNNILLPEPVIEERQPLIITPPEQLIKVSRVNKFIKNGTKESVYWVEAGVNTLKLRVPEPEGRYYNVSWSILSQNVLDYSMALKLYTDLLEGLIKAGHEKKLDMPKKTVIKDDLTSAFASYDSNTVKPVEISSLKSDAMQRAMRETRSEVDFVNFSVEDPMCPFLDFTLKLFSNDAGHIGIKASRKKGMEVPVGWAELMLRDYNNPDESNLNTHLAEQLAIELNRLTLKP